MLGMEAKYIVIDYISAIVFGPAIGHEVEAAGRNVTSAGSCKIYLEKPGDVHKVGPTKLVVECWGESFSLGGIKSNPELDSQLIKMMLIEEH